MIKSKYENTRRADKNLLTSLILIVVFAAAIVAFIIIRSITPDDDTATACTHKNESGLSLDSNGDNVCDECGKKIIIAGESSYLGVPIAYPRIESSGVDSISIWVRDENGDNHKLSFAIQRGGMSVYKNNFYFSYTNQNGVIVDYTPPIADADPYFDYSDLHAAASDTSSASSVAIPKITYVTTALGALYFDERIEVPSDENKKRAFLERYGITEDSPRIIIEATNVDGDEVSYAVTVGKKTVTGSTYYFTVAEENANGEFVERPYVYATQTNYLDYALVNFESFLHSTLVSAGLEQDAALEPIFTEGYYQWKNSVYKYRTDKDGNILGYYFVKDGVETDVDEWYVEKDDTAILDVIRIMPYESVPTGTKLQEYEQLGFIIGDDGYLRSPSQKIEVDLEEFAEYGNNRYIVSTLTGIKGGYVPENTLITQLDEYKNVMFVISEEETYSYKITAIESVFENGKEVVLDDPAVPNEAVKVTYDYYVLDKKENKVPYHAVIVLDESASLIDVVTREKLLNASVGACDIQFDITYTTGDEDTAANAIVCTSKIILRQITGIYDSTGRYLKEANAGSFVSFNYYIEETYTIGDTVIYSEKVEAEKPMIVDLSDGEVSDAVREFFVGKAMDDYEHMNLTVTSTTTYRQPMRDFYTFDIESVSSAVKAEPVVAFKYLRVDSPAYDPFYRESIYENLLTGEYGAYALNAQSCQSVVSILGGIGESANTSEGLKGSKTVAVGITPEVMEKYGLYANTILFILPRGFYDADPEGNYDRDVYGAYDTLAFELYISDETEDGKRYIGSDMYDIVAEIDAANFRFLDSSFIDIWARRNIAMVDVDDIEKMNVSLDFDDFSGSYNFMFITKTASNENGQTKDVLYIYGALDKTKPYTETEFTKYASKTNSQGSIAAYIDGVYESLSGEQTPYGKEGEGVSNYKEFLRMIYTTYYCHTLTAEEQAAYKSNKVLMSMTFDIAGTDKEYGYEFRRVNDAYVMVSIYTVLADGTVTNEASDFCISTPAFKKIASSFVGILNGKKVDGDVYSGAVK